MSWHLKEQLQAALGREQGAAIFAPGARSSFALIYPNTYHVGMSNLGLQIIYQKINNRSDTACERLFMPDRKTEKEYIRTNTPLMTIETQRPLYQFPLIGFAITFEMDYFNVLKILSMGRVPLLAAERADAHPIVIAGGPCATFNPEPLTDFIDLFIIGEGEEVINELLDQYYEGCRENLPREELLLKLAQIEGIYVPRFYRHDYHADGTVRHIAAVEDAPDEVKKRWIKDLDKHSAQTVVVTADTEFRDLYLVEVARGCGRHCRFCMAGYCYRRPRIRSLGKIMEAVSAARLQNKKVGLMGAAISDYPQIDQLCANITKLGMGLSVASLRADSLTEGLVAALAASGQKTITLAPEAASVRMRNVINKGIDDEHLIKSISMASQAGIPNVRLYIMIGLPYEDNSDIEAIAAMAVRFKGYMESSGSKGLLTLSINPFIPKPFTPFQWLPMANMREVEQKLKFLQSALRNRKGIELLVESPKEAYIQGILARGDRRLGAVLLTACELGGSKYFKRALKEHGLQEEFYLYRERPLQENLPWQKLNMGFDSSYLQQELQRARKEQYTVPCMEGCTRCGICANKEEATWDSL